MITRLFFFLVLLPVLAWALPAHADYVTGLNPRGDNFLALRSGPGTGYRTILRMGPDTIVTVLERRGDWLRVELEDGTRGWAFGDYIAPGFPPGYVEGFEDDLGPGGAGPVGDKAQAEEEETAATLDLDAVSALIEQGWATCADARFGTAVDYPSGLYAAALPRDNDDGRSFESRLGVGGFIVRGSHNVFDRTLDELMADDEAGGGYDAVTYRRGGEDWYVLSGYRAGDVFYRKVMLSDGGGVIHTFEITYPRAARSVLDPVAARMGKSMRADADLVAAREETSEPLASGQPIPDGVPATGAVAVAFDAWKAPVEELLFGGGQTPLFLPHEAHGGIFAQHARYDGGALVVDVPAGNGWGKVGLLSNDPLVWLDEFRDDAEVRVTFALDPVRTTGFGLALTQTGWGGVGGNDPAPPGARFYWIRAADGASATGEVHMDPHREGDFFSQSLAPVAPSEVTFVLRPGQLAVELDGTVLASRPWTSLADGVGLRIYAFSHVAEVEGPARMALEAISVSRRYPARIPIWGPAPGVEPLPVETLFAGEPTALFEPVALAGGDFDAFARYERGALVIDVPEGRSWAKTGLISTEPIVRLDDRNRQTPTRLTLSVDPAATSSFVLALAGDRVAEMWPAHNAWFTLMRFDDAGVYRMGLHASPYNDRVRNVPVDWVDAHWDGTIAFDFGDGVACMRLGRGPSLCAGMPVGVGYAYYATILAHAPAEGRPARLALNRITRGLVTPPGMTADRRWFFLDDADFDPAQFLQELKGLLQ